MSPSSLLALAPLAAPTPSDDPAARPDAGEGVAWTIWVDAGNGGALFEEVDQPLGSGAGALHRTRSDSDPCEVQGLRIPYASSMEDVANGRIDFTLERLETRLDLSENDFRVRNDRR